MLRDIDIEVHHLYKSFGDHQVLKDLSFELKKEENLVVLGKSGSGKSVLIRCIIGLIKAESGTIKVLGKNINNLTHDELDELRLNVGFLFQNNALYDSMTVRENLEFPLRKYKRTPKFLNLPVPDLVAEALENVGLPHTINMMPSQLSGGMRKRIALARTLILRPSIILYDEPTTGLDPITSREIGKLIIDIQQKYKASSIIISHDMNFIKLVANRILLLIDGGCYFIGTYKELQMSEDPQIKSFFK